MLRLFLVICLLFPSTVSAHFIPGRHNARHAIVSAWCGKKYDPAFPCQKGAQALRVAWCESRLDRYANNGQYLGLMQMGASERARFGHGVDPWTQAYAAHRYYLLSGWHPWECAHLLGLV